MSHSVLSVHLSLPIKKQITAVTQLFMKRLMSIRATSNDDTFFTFLLKIYTKHNKTYDTTKTNINFPPNKKTYNVFYGLCMKKWSVVFILMWFPTQLLTRP